MDYLYGDAEIHRRVATTVHETEDELNKAILFIRACQETGTDLRKYYATAMDGTELYKKGYTDGFTAGMQEVRNRLENAFKEKSVW